MVVSTNYGQIEGTAKNGCEIFLGIPYAKPPVGPLRFHKPRRLKPWSGVYRADHFGCRSMQTENPRDTFYKKEFYSNPDFACGMSEDCLYLNIWVPGRKDTARSQEKLPVAVYIHGGAFLGGAGSNLPFVCDNLAKAGVIVVTVNYRLGALGFLCHPLLGVPGENEAGGNYGLWDQIAAIAWVIENIAAFGGDPENVTVFGQSAGAMSLQVLAVSEQTDGLFARMILQSGGGYRHPLGECRSIERASGFAEDLLAALGIRDREWTKGQEQRKRALAALYETSEEEMMRAAEAAVAQAFIQRKGMPFVPVIDGELLTKDQDALIEEGRFHAIPYLLGANGDDLTTENRTERLPENNPMQAANLAFAEKVSGAGRTEAYVYYFDRKLPGDESGAFHSAELWYVFGSLSYCWRPFTEADHALSAEMIGYWTNFMKNGNPNGDGLPEWSAYTQENPYVRRLDIK